MQKEEKGENRRKKQLLINQKQFMPIIPFTHSI